MICPCYCNLDYTLCCKPYHDGLELPPNPLTLMRSRYAAYALNRSDYIIQTTHPTSPHFSTDLSTWKDEIEEFSFQFDFVGLTIISEEKGSTLSYVTFKAHLKNDTEDGSFTERSLFIFENDRWFFC